MGRFQMRHWPKPNAREFDAQERAVKLRGKLDEVDNIVGTALQAIRQGRIGFSVQQVNCVNHHHEVLYSECLARLLKLGGSVVTSGEFMPALDASGYAPELDRSILSLAFEWLSNSASGSLGCNVSSLNFSTAEHRRCSMINSIEIGGLHRDWCWRLLRARRVSALRN